jgi:hypothetical protein
MRFVPVLSIVFAAVLCGCRSNVDLSAFPSGLEKKPRLCPNTVRPDFAAREFLPYSKAFKRDKAGNLLFNVEKRDEQEPWHYAAIGPVPVKPATRYNLIFNLEKRYKDEVLFYISYAKNGQPDVVPHVFMLHVARGVSSPTGATVSQEMITSTGCDGMYIWLIASNSGKKVKPGVKAVFTRFELEELGPSGPASALAARAGENLLQFDLSKMPPGKILKSNSAFHPGSKLKMVIAEVRQDGSDKVLHVKYEKGMYLYPHFTTVKAPFKDALCRYSFKIRGKGVIRPGLWFKRDYVSFYYSHGVMVTLSDKWQEVILEYGCVDPLVHAVSVSITNSGESVEYDAKDLKLEVVLP